jgi:hypothetical protein
MLVQTSLGRLNCAGQLCPERSQCRRYRVLIPSLDSDRDRPHGEWASFDLERVAAVTCEVFVLYRGER